MSVLLDTGATVSVLSESAWENSGNVSGIKPVTGRLTTTNSNELPVLGEAEARFRIGNIECSWPVMIIRCLNHDCILGSDFFNTVAVRFIMTLGLLWLGILRFQSDTAK